MIIQELLSDNYGATLSEADENNPRPYYKLFARDGTQQAIAVSGVNVPELIKLLEILLRT